MSVESLVDAYETVLGKFKGRLVVHAGYTPRMEPVSGQYLAEATAVLNPEESAKPPKKAGEPVAGNALSEPEYRPSMTAIALHTNPSVALLLAKAIAVSEVVGEPTLPFYEDTQEIRAVSAPVVSAPAPAANAQAAPAPAAPVDNANRPVVDPDGKVRCWEVDEKGHVCGAEIKAWDGKSPSELGEARKRKYGIVLCPKHIAIRKKAGQ